jgi:hypothetical protein
MFFKPISDIKLNCLYRKVPLKDAEKVLLKVSSIILAINKKLEA